MINIFIPLHVHVSINMAAFHVLVLLLMSVRALESSARALRVCVSLCVTERLRGQMRETNISESVLLRYHTLRPMESVPGAV